METRPLFRGSLRTPCTSTSRSVYHLRFDLIAKCPLKEDRNKNRYCESRDGHNPRCDSCPPFLGLHYCGNQCNEGAKTTYCSKIKYKNLGEAFASSDDIHIYQCEDSCKNSHECQDVGIHMLFNIPNLIGLLVNHLNFILHKCLCIHPNPGSRIRRRSYLCKGAQRYLQLFQKQVGQYRRSCSR